MAPEEKRRQAGIRIGADVGGTFTDVVLLDEEGNFSTLKVASTPEDFSRAVVAGVVELLRRRGEQAAAVRDVVHGTTVATNAILELKGARTGLLTTRGFRDVLELRRLRVPRLYDLFWDKPRPLVEREYRLEVDERIDGSGQMLRALDLTQAERAAEQLIAGGVESIAVVLLHAYANPAHEQALGRLLARRWPHLAVSLSSEVLPLIREYERTSTTVINAYVKPLVGRYVESLRRQLDAEGIEAPLLIMQSNGGVMSDRAAAEKPAYMIESGPAAGVIAGVELARGLGIANAITFDMGGTTAKTSLIEQGLPDFTSEFEVGSGISLASRLITGGGYALSVPFIDLAEVGAGGGSIVWIDEGGAPRVGPRSAGAVPGPVCYARGGAEPTVTDANVVLGYINPLALLDGALPIDAEAARQALRLQIAEPLGLPLMDAAYGAHQLANASMIRGVKAVSSHRGRDPRQFTIIAFGGNGPVHVAGIARELEIGRIVVPPSPGLFSAFGLLSAELEHHAVRTFLRPTTSLRPDELAVALRELEERGRREFGQDGAFGRDVEVERWAELRYIGQSFQLPVRLAAGSLKQQTIRELEEAFAREHERTYGHRTANAVEVVNLRVVTRRARDGMGVWEFGCVGGDEANDSHAPIPPPSRTTSVRPAYFGPEHGSLETMVLRRQQLSKQPLRGPLIVEEYDATAVVSPDWTAHIDERGNIVMEAVGG